MKRTFKPYRNRLASLLSLSFATFLAGAPCVTQAQDNTYDPNRFEKTLVVGGLTQPMEMAIAPDGTIYLIELAGKIKAIDPNTGESKTIGSLKVTTEQENGLIGIALDPKFAQNRWMYLQYSPPDFSGQHISRFAIAPDGALDLESEKILMKYQEQRKECCHHAGSMEFGPDGCLYIGTGDNTNPFGDSQGFAPIDEREEKSAFNALRTSANTKSYNGKILRIRPSDDGTYSIPDGNLFPKDGSVGHPEIYVMGCRNPWRLNIDQRTGFLYWGDVGPDAGGDGPRGPRGYDEFNQARKAGFFGWPLFIGNNRPYLQVDFSSGSIGNTFDPSKPINDSKFNTGAKELPPAQPAWIYYPGGDSKEFPALGSGGRTACAGPTYYYDGDSKSQTKFPAGMDKTVFIYEWSRNWIVAVKLDQDSNIAKMERFMPNEKFIRPIDLQFDKNGSLLVIEYGETWGVNPDAKLVRVDYQAGNRTPQARIAEGQFAGKEPLKLAFSAEASSDKDKDPLSFTWTKVNSADSADRVVIGTGVQIEHTFEKPGVYNVEVKVLDPQGASTTAVVPVIVGNSVPTIEFVSPKDGDFFDAGQKVNYQVTVTDQEDGSSDEKVTSTTDLDNLDAAAPDRVSIQANLLAGGSSVVNEESLPVGLKLMRSSDCFNCHALDRAIVGPSFLDIANKYRGQDAAMEASIDRVLKGSTGVWGKVAMLPHGQHTREQVTQMVAWVYDAKPDPTSQTVRGMSGTIELTGKPENAGAAVRLTARYQDLGGPSLPSLTGYKTIELKPRLREAERADQIVRMSELAGGKAGQGKFLGAIDHGSYFVIKNVRLDQVGSLNFRVCSAGAGGEIVVHQGALDGPVIGKIRVDVNGDWDGWYERSMKIEPTAQQADLYFEALNPTNRGGLMNIDSVRFDPK
ncbi:MAG: PQQ-dependent sugar dehydrogenase [Planctomycetaceae bacterium]|jgi:cytochrome c|nr:PQQ-dependent sugar dehydrogenase [Planctomycetaceae bacterium]